MSLLDFFKHIRQIIGVQESHKLVLVINNQALCDIENTCMNNSLQICLGFSMQRLLVLTRKQFSESVVIHLHSFDNVQV